MGSQNPNDKAVKRCKTCKREFPPGDGGYRTPEVPTDEPESTEKRWLPGGRVLAIGWVALVFAGLHVLSYFVFGGMWWMPEAALGAIAGTLLVLVAIAATVQAVCVIFGIDGPADGPDGPPW